MNYLTFNSETRAPNLGQQPCHQRPNPVTTRVETLRQGALRPGPAHDASLSERRVEPLSFTQMVEQFRRDVPQANRESIVRMMQEIDKAFDQTKLFSICGLSIHPPAACSLFNVFRGELAERLAAICERDVNYLFYSWSKLPQNSPLKGFFELALCKVEPVILNRRDYREFIYKITNQQGIPSYVIGATHWATEHMIKKRAFSAVLDQCNELITELGEEFIPFMRKEFDPRNTDPLKYSIDGQLTMYAIEKGLPVRALETVQLQQTFLPPPLEARTQRWSLIAGVDQCQRGEEHEFINSVNRHGDGTLRDRNSRWLRGSPEKPGLIEQLRHTASPLAIAVGADHLFGYCGLLEGFERAGFRVERV